LETLHSTHLCRPPKKKFQFFHSLIKSPKPSIHFTAKTEQDGWFFLHLCSEQKAANEHARNV